MQAWDTLLPSNGVAITPPEMPDSSLLLDNQIEQGSFNSAFLSSVFNPSVTTQKLFVDAVNLIIGVGSGDQIAAISPQGFFAGNAKFSLSPFRVDLNGNLTANNVTVSGYIVSGGAAADINANSTTVNGNKITAASITSSQIASSTITGSNISSSTITGSNISGSTITGSNIAANTITASNMNVTTLSSISANIGTITAGSITGITITGGTIQTSSSGKRVVVNGSNNSVDLYSSGGQVGYLWGATDNSGIELVASSGKNISITASSATVGITGAISQSGGNSNFGGVIYPAGDNTYTCGANGARWSAVWAANGTIQTSDMRFKKDIEPLDRGLDFILSLNPIKFIRTDDNKLKYGLISQEVAKVLGSDFETMIYGDEEKGYGLNYSDFVPSLIKAVQELHTKVAKLESQNV